MANNVKYTRKDKKESQTILQTDEQKDRKDVRNKMKKVSEEDSFNKYLENRKREELEALYQERRDKLKKAEQELYEVCQEPVHITLDLEEKNKYEREAKPKRKQLIEDRR